MRTQISCGRRFPRFKRPAERPISGVVPLPPLTIAIPTFCRERNLAALIDCLAEQIGDRDDIKVLVSDNASTDGTGDYLRAATAKHSWLSSHRQETNIGGGANFQWVLEHAPEAEMLWLIGDDDVLEAGALDHVLAMIEEHHPAWLYLPHRWVTADGAPFGASPVPESVRVYPSSGHVYRNHHHWPTFISSCVVRWDLYRAAARRRWIDNGFLPYLWCFEAALEGPCVAADKCLVIGGADITWKADRAKFLTADYVGIFELGLSADVTREEFAAGLDELYSHPANAPLWRERPLEELVAAVSQFPHAETLRWLLWQTARRDELPELLEQVQTASAEAGAQAVAETLIGEGEALFVAGDVAGAAQRFSRSVQISPADGVAWSNLAVALSALGNAEASEAVDSALFIDPSNVDARLNRALIRANARNARGALEDALAVLEVEPGNATAAELVSALAPDGVRT